MDFIVVMAPDRTRFTHTDVARIGGEFTGNIDRALAGQTFTETYPGTLGPSIRAVAPVRDGRRRHRRAGVGGGDPRTDRAERAGHPARDRTRRRHRAAAGPGRRHRCWNAGCGAGRWACRSRICGRSTSSARRCCTRSARVCWCSTPTAVPRWSTTKRDGCFRFRPGPLTRAQLPGSLGSTGADVLTDETHVTADRVLLVNQQPVQWEGREVGTVMTLRDRTDLQRVSGELSSVTQFAESLRSRAHEADNRLHTVITMVELGRTDDAVQFATAELARVPAAHRPADVDGRRTRPGGAAARQDEPGPRSRRRTHRHRGLATRRSRQRRAHPGRIGHAGRQSRRQRHRRRPRRRTRLGGGDGARHRRRS